MLILCSILKIMLLWFQKMLRAVSSKTYKPAFQFRLFQLFFPVLMLLGRNMDFRFRTLFLEERISLHPLQNKLPSLTIKFSRGKCFKLAHVTRLSLHHCFLSAFLACQYLPLVHSKDPSRAIVEGTGLCSPSELPFMSKFREDGVADAILLEQAKGLWKLSPDQLGPDFFRVSWLSSEFRCTQLSQFRLQSQKSCSQTQKQIITTLASHDVDNWKK